MRSRFGWLESRELSFIDVVRDDGTSKLKKEEKRRRREREAKRGNDEEEEPKKQGSQKMISSGCERSAKRGGGVEMETSAWCPSFDLLGTDPPRPRAHRYEERRITRSQGVFLWYTLMFTLVQSSRSSSLLRCLDLPASVDVVCFSLCDFC